MAGRRTNIALLLLLTAALASGAVSFAVGTPAHGWAAVAHGIAGLGVLVMTPWKSTIVRRGLARRRRSRAASIALLAAVASALIAGVLHSSGLARALGPVTTMQLHVGAALLALPLAAWHLIARPVRIGRSDVSRRQLLRSGLLLAGAGGAYLGIEGALRLARLPGGRRRFTGSYETGSLDPERMPVT
jgi:hypothetical protein